MLNLKTLLVVACALAYGEEEDAALLRFETFSLPIVVVFEGCGGVEARNFFLWLGCYQLIEIFGVLSRETPTRQRQASPYFQTLTHPPFKRQAHERFKIGSISHVLICIIDVLPN